MDIIKDEKVLKIIEKIKNASKLTALESKIYVVGGVIRDSLLKQPIKDIDIVVNAKEGGIVLANLLAAREKCYVLNSNPVIFPTYGTAKVCLFKDEELKNINIEFTDTKKTIYGPTDLHFGTVEEDARRRDLTINALYWNVHDEKLYDPTGYGISDLTTQTLRCPATLF